MNLDTNLQYKFDREKNWIKDLLTTPIEHSKFHIVNQTADEQ